MDASPVYFSSINARAGTGGGIGNETLPFCARDFGIERVVDVFMRIGGILGITRNHQ